MDTGESAKEKMRSLYLCYFGLREPLVQTQVLPYLRELVHGGIEIELMTFEPGWPASWTLEDKRSWEGRLKKDGIIWTALRYHKCPSLPATLYDVLAGTVKIVREHRRRPIDVLHARGYVPAVMGAMARRVTRSRLIFDIRGLMPEEYVDAGVWPAGGMLYRVTKAAERWLMASADGFVVLTEKARELLFPGAIDDDGHGKPVEVIPCCVDFTRFEAQGHLTREDVRRELGLEGRRVMVYVGALGGWYLTEEMSELLATAHRRDTSTFSLILTQSDPEMIGEPLRRRGVKEEDFLVRKVEAAEVPHYLKAADVAISLIKPCYSKLSSSPTKIAEYLAGGLPVVSNTGIGDLDVVIEDDNVGVIVRSLNLAGYVEALGTIDMLRQDPQLPGRCRSSAKNRFDMEVVGGYKYRRLYWRIFGKQSDF